MNEEIQATFASINFSFGDVIIATSINEYDESVTVKGTDLPNGFTVGQAYRFYGRWAKYTNKFGEMQDQFHFNTAVECSPLGQRGVIAYLQQCPGVGEKTAQRIWYVFGSRSVAEFREGNMDTFIEATSMKRKTFANGRDYLRIHHKREQCTIDLMNLLDKQGLPKQTMQRCLDEWGNAGAEFIKKNPYLLMRFPGVGFRRCDRMYLSFGGDPTRLRRQALCGWYGIDQQHASGGHTWIRDHVADSAIRGMVGGADVTERRAVRLAIRADVLNATYTEGIQGELDWDGNIRWLADSRKSGAEKRLAGYIIDAMRDKSAEPRRISLDSSAMSSHQFEEIGHLFAKPGCLKLITGGPGTGKTYVIAQITKAFLKTIGPDQIAIAAPTGKAAVRITEALSEYGIKITARTWHSTLGVEQSSAGNGFAFRHGPANPLPYEVVIGDEQSMQDTGMAEAAFSARAKGTLFLLVGDVNQLSPVGHGAPLRDMIRAGVPNAELVEVRRNSGEIVEQCRNIRENGTIEFVECIDGSNLEVHQCISADTQLRFMNYAISSLPGGIDPVWDCQVLTPTNKSKELGRKALNTILQKQLNDSPEVKGTPFRLGDKVVCLRNSWFKCDESDETAVLNDKNEAYVANGDIGKVTRCEPKRMEIELKSPFRRIITGRSPAKQQNGSDADDGDATNKPTEDAGTGCSWDLAYALSVHKAQGSESPYVIVMLDDSGGARRLCDRSWIYTAISRAKIKCIVIGKESVAKSMCAINKIEERKTFLAELISNSKAETWRG